MINQDNKDPKPLVEFVNDDSWRPRLMTSIEDGVNSETNFAITKLTGGGAWLRGNLLFYNLNGVSVYTDPKNIIFVDIDNHTLFIREYNKIEQIAPKNNPEEREYIILYSELVYDDASDAELESAMRWEAVVGRTNVYESIKVNAPVIDIDKSLVLVETVALKDALSVRQFMEHLKNADIINDESFDINDYVGSNATSYIRSYNG